MSAPLKVDGGFPLRSILTVNMRPDEQRVVKVPEKITYLTTLPLETGATALRIGLVNTTDLPFPIDGVCVCESAKWMPSGDVRWAYFSFSGEASEDVKPAASAICAVRVPRTKAHPVTGARNVPIIIWSDWMDFRTESGANRPQLLFRTLISTKVAILGFPGQPRVPLPGQPPRLRAQCTVVGDYVTQPDQQLPEITPSPFSPITVVQYRATVPGLQILIGGDSHLARPSIFPQLVADQLSTSEAPISVWNTAREARNSNTFWPALDDAIDMSRPSIAVIQGWTANDGMTPEGDQAYLLRVKESAERTLAAGGIPVIVKGLPRHLFGKPALASWQAVNQKIDTLVPGALVFDPLPYVENRKMPGNWINKLSDDGVHPNRSANLALLEPFKDLIASRLKEPYLVRGLDTVRRS